MTGDTLLVGKYEPVRLLQFRAKVLRRELDNLALIFNNGVVLRAAGNEILRSAEANTLT